MSELKNKELTIARPMANKGKLFVSFLLTLSHLPGSVSNLHPDTLLRRLPICIPG